jgi:hypothetical protein
LVGATKDKKRKHHAGHAAGTLSKPHGSKNPSTVVPHSVNGSKEVKRDEHARKFGQEHAER